MFKHNHAARIGLVSLAVTTPLVHQAAYCGPQELCRIEAPILPDEPAQRPFNGVPGTLVTPISTAGGTVTTAGSATIIAR